MTATPAGNDPVRNVFISYRRGDSAGHSGRLLDALEHRFGRNRFFRDIEDLEPGVDFPEALDRVLSHCEVLLVMIGPTWASAAGEHGRRLDEAGDFVRLEVATGLARKDVRVIPVLVNGARMPAAEELPENLRTLARRNAIELSDTRWDYDVKRLGDTLAKHLGIAEAAPPAAASGRRPFGKLAMALGGGGALLAASLLSGLWSSGDAPRETIAEQPAAGPAGTFEVGNVEWTTDDRNANLDWNAATAYCEHLTVGSASGWRLPTTKELMTIYDPGDVTPFGFKLMRPFHAGISSNWIWSSDKDTASAAFVVDFKTGERCRSRSTPPTHTPCA